MIVWKVSADYSLMSLRMSLSWPFSSSVASTI